jgi:uncharacterized protein YdiU (UPF0061 family)
VELQSWIRFGTLEFLHYRGEEEKLKSIVDYIIESFYPECILKEGKVTITTTRLVHSQLYDPKADYLDESIMRVTDGNQNNGPVTISLNRYGIFFQMVIERTAKLVATWQAHGYVHGLLNTVT